ncbi:MAG: putative lipid II flippase FtsW [Armatimonadetes bacterium]|jgi:cell division protein FtsW|nr:putative lipid II flippase FtsW [Armatimonadota bacterium]
MVRERHPVDVHLLIAVALLVACGILFIYDASFVRASQTHYTHFDPEYFLKRQAMWACIGAVALLLAAIFPYWKLDRLAVVGIAVAVLMLVVVLVAGHTSHGAKRWFALGPVRLQPSEFAKLAMVLFLARWIAVHQKRLRRLKEGFIPLATLPVLLAALIAVEPDLGTALVVMGTGAMMLYLGGARKRHLALLAASGVVAVVGLILAEPFRLERIRAWSDPSHDAQGSGYQVLHSLIALGSGGPFGVGLGQGRQKYFYLPAEHTDYILGTIGEELGLLGTMGVLFLFLYLVVRGFTIAHRTKDPFGSLLASGLSSLIAVQALLNIAVVTKTVPPTGVPLPFISYGGSSLVFTMIAIGLLVNISQYPVPPRATKQTGKDGNEDLTDRRRDGRAYLSGARGR